MTKNNKILYLATKRKTNSYHMKKRRGKREWMERMNSRVWFIKNDRISELKKKINEQTSSLTRVSDPKVRWYWIS